MTKAENGPGDDVAQRTRGRYPAVDSARGVVMVVMALDHASYFWNGGRSANEGLGGYVPRYNGLLQMLTRLSAHFTPTTFMWLAGFALALSVSRRERRGETARRIDGHLLARVLVLLLLQFTVVNFAFMPAPVLHLRWKAIFFLDVLFAIGAGIALVALLRRLGSVVLIAVVLLSFLLPPFFYRFLSSSGHGSGLLRAFAIAIWDPGTASDAPIACIYPVIPWFGVVLFGYLAGRWFLGGARKKPSALAKPCFHAGVGFSLIFLLVRACNGYGNRIIWESFTLQGFLTLSKYPPSLAFLVFTFSLMFLLLSLCLWAGRGQGRLRTLTSPLQVFGRAPLFFYCLHLPVYGLIPCFFTGTGRFGLGTTYAVWLLGLLLLYHPCRWYFRHRSTLRFDSVKGNPV